MAIISSNSSHVRGISACVPSSQHDIREIPQISDSEIDGLTRFIGLQKRRKATHGETTADLCAFAAENLINELSWSKEDIKLLCLVTQTPDYQLPASAIVLQDRLGLSMDCMAFDINLGCTGFAYGLSVVSRLLTPGSCEKALLLMGETSNIVSESDKSTYPLMGDAGTAIALEYGEDAPSMHFNLQSFGKHYEAIIIPDGGARNPVNKESFELKEINPGIRRSRLHATLDADVIVRFCLQHVEPNIRGLINAQDISVDEFDFVIFHQANRLINERLRNKLKIAPSKVPYSIQQFGNTSSASIPLTLVSQISEQLKSGKNQLLCSGFGAGLSIGTAILSLDKIVCPAVLEYPSSIKNKAQ